jgi:hypothetical protein
MTYMYKMVMNMVIVSWLEIKNIYLDDDKFIEYPNSYNSHIYNTGVLVT